MITALTVSISMATVVSYKYLSRRKRHKEIPQYRDYVSVEYMTDEYAEALQDYKTNGKSVLKKYNQAV